MTSDVSIALDSPLSLGDQTLGAAQRTVGGSAAIAAHNAALLGLCPVAFAGHVGADGAGTEGLHELHRAGVEIDATVPTAVSAHVFVLVDPNGERTMVASPGCPDWNALRPSWTPSDLVLFEGWHLFAPGSYPLLFGSARAAGATVALDVCSASRADDPAAHARLLTALAPDVLFANELEATTYGLEPQGPDQLLVVHRGAAPTCIWHGGMVREVPVTHVDVIDSTGAGDTFAGAFLAALASGRNIEGCAEIAHRAAAAVVQCRGGLARQLAMPVG